MLKHGCTIDVSVNVIFRRIPLATMNVVLRQSYVHGYLSLALHTYSCVFSRPMGARFNKCTVLPSRALASSALAFFVCEMIFEHNHFVDQPSVRLYRVSGRYVCREQYRRSLFPYKNQSSSRHHHGPHPTFSPHQKVTVSCDYFLNLPRSCQPRP